jgi:hypothetical protein
MSFPSPKEFYEKYENNHTDARKVAREIGLGIGRQLLQRLNIQGGSLEAVAAVLNEFQKEVQGEPNALVQDRKVIMRCTGFCPIMRTALTLNIPWKWLDDNFALPLVEGIASYIISDIKLRLPQMKSRGDSECLYIFEVEG